MAQKEIALDIRLRNCLQTILELEEVLITSDFGTTLGEEFTVLKDVAGRLEYSFVEEKDVQKIENATERFLKEIQQNLAMNQMSLSSGSHVLQ